MPAIHVRNVSETTIAAIKERAVRHKWSMQQEIRRLLDAAAAEPIEPEQLPPLRLVIGHSGGKSTWSRDEIYDDDGR